MKVECPKSINDKIEKINWTNLETVYGSTGDIVPKSLRDLYSTDEKKAIKASNFLWSSLCKNNAFISSASLPSYDIISSRLKQECNEKLEIELLDLIFSFSCSINKSSNDSNYQSLIEKLKLKILKDKPFFKELMRRKDKNAYVKVFAEEILEQLR